MNEFIYRLASNISTPLALAGAAVALFSYIILALIKSGILRITTSADSAIIIKRFLTFFFVLALVATLLGGIGWIYANTAGKERRVEALKAFGHLVTTMRNETEKLYLDY